MIIICVCSIASKAQNNFTVAGKVVDARTNERLKYVNIFLSQTSMGTTTNSEGGYKISNIPSGRYNLVASMVGYEAKIIEVELKADSKVTIDFNLEPTIYKLNQIDVKDEIPLKWREQLEFFEKLILGDNSFADECIIKNRYKINFSENEDQFTAEINEPLIIKNNALGYMIESVLKNFIYNKKTRITSYQIYPSFSEIIPLTQDSLIQFRENRNYSYAGSLAHVLSCLTHQGTEFSDEGFTINYMDFNSVFGSIDSAKQIVSYDPQTQRYLINPRMGAVRKYKNWHKFSETGVGLKIHYLSSNKSSDSKIFPRNGEYVEFDPGGYFINPDQCIVYGDMAKEGVATMLPRFWKPIGGK